jgi:hypothetical protein
MNPALPPIADEQEARAIIAAGLGRAELEFAMSLTAPLYWIIREDENQYRVRNGSAFFLDAGEGPFAVTANHVVKGWRDDQAKGNVVALRLGLDLQLDFAGKNAIIAEHPEIDIATFRISRDEIGGIGKGVLTGYQRAWPPAPPQQDRGVYYSGFPGRERIWLSPHEISFGAAAVSGVASSVSETNVSSLVERQNLIVVLGGGIPPEDYDFGGMSGGPMLMVIETGTIRSWSLAGVIYQGPNPSPDTAQAIAGLEIIRARRAHFILPDGQLDVRRWNELAPSPPLAPSRPNVLRDGAS